MDLKENLMRMRCPYILRDRKVHEEIFCYILSRSSLHVEWLMDESIKGALGYLVGRKEMEKLIILEMFL